MNDLVTLLGPLEGSPGLPKNQGGKKVSLSNIYELGSAKLSALRPERPDPLIASGDAQPLKANDITFGCIASYLADSGSARLYAGETDIWPASPSNDLMGSKQTYLEAGNTKSQHCTWSRDADPSVE